MGRFSYTAGMSRKFDPLSLDVAAFARDAASLTGTESLRGYARLTEDAADVGDGGPVVWEARGESRQVNAGPVEVWLHLQAQATVPLVCQRCLERVDVPLQVNRSFRFVADEALAAQQDEECDEDVLVLSRDFNLHDLVEDELLMALPLTPKHAVCPREPRLSAVDAAFSDEPAVQENPFAALASLKTGKPR